MQSSGSISYRKLRHGAGRELRQSFAAEPQEEVTRMRRQYNAKRLNTTIWYPRAHQLQLPDVPREHQVQVRKLLTPALRKMTQAHIPVQGKHCWQIAQALVMAINNPRCNYVEGVWTRPHELDDVVCECGENHHKEPAPHAWNTIDGHRVCLVRELYNYNSYGGDGDWLYEPLHEYSHAEINKMVEDGEISGLDDLAWSDFGDISGSYLFWKTHTEESLPEHLRGDKEPDPGDFGRPKLLRDANHKETPAFKQWQESEDHAHWSAAFNEFWNARNEYIDKIVFKPAVERLIERHKVHGAAA
jgi:hypothetical protein